MNPSRRVEPDLAPLPLARLYAMAHPIRAGLFAMVALSTVGTLVGLVPPLAIGWLINALTAHHGDDKIVLLAVAIVVAIIVETLCYVASEGLYARNTSHLFRILRERMFEGAHARRLTNAVDADGLASRFISDAESIEATVGLLDQGSMQIIEVTSAVVALGLLSPLSVAVVVPVVVVTWTMLCRFQGAVGVASQERQVELEHMTQSINRELAVAKDGNTSSRFRSVLDGVFNAEVRLGWLESANLQGSGGVAKVGPIIPLIVAALTGTDRPGTLIALYLLCQRAFQGVDGLVDLRLGMHAVRGPLARCFELFGEENVTPPDEPLVAPIG